MLNIQRWFLGNSLKNYQYFLNDDENAIIIDPLRADKYLEYLLQNNLNLKAILITHKHGDHIAGVEKILAKFPDAKVYAYSDNERFSPDIYVKDGDAISLGFCNFKVLYTPGHISDHVCFLFGKEKALFCGDTVFNAGVGGVSAATADVTKLCESIQKIMKLDTDVCLYPAHDYWQSNLDFALSILPKDEMFQKYRDEIAPLPAEQKPILNIKDEQKINIFMRSFCDEKLLSAISDKSLGQEMFIELRERKNKF